MKIIAIIQARIGSTRLPGKVLKKIKDKTVLDYVIERLEFCEKLDDIVLAITISKKDDILEEYVKAKGVKYFRGDEEDVLKRFYETAKKHNADIIVRITSDCPLIDPYIVDGIIRKHIESKADYTANIIKRTYPRGLDVEVLNFKILEETYNLASRKYQREHVTPYIREHPEKFRLQNVEAKGKLNRPDIRITVDTKEDFELVERILLNFDKMNFTAEDFVNFLDKNPELLDLNKNVEQKELKE